MKYSNLYYTLELFYSHSFIRFNVFFDNCPTIQLGRFIKKPRSPRHSDQLFRFNFYQN